MKTNALLAHLLSPLEQAAMRHKFNPFNYKLGSVRVYISASMCKQLANITMQKANMLGWGIKKDKMAKGIPFKLREVVDDPRIIMSLHPRLRNQLCRLECYTLLSIKEKGRSYFADEEKFSPRAMQTLDALFEKHNCQGLFK